MKRVKESLKNFLLILLILSSVILSLELWFADENSPDLFSSRLLVDTFFKEDIRPVNSESYREYAYRIFVPTGILYRNEASSSLIIGSEAQMQEEYSGIKREIGRIMSASSYTINADLSKEAFIGVLKNDSIFMEFDAAIPIQVFFEAIGSPLKENIDEFLFSKVAINPARGSSELYFLSAYDGSVMRITCEESKELRSLLSAKAEEGGLPSQFIFEREENGNIGGVQIASKEQLLPEGIGQTVSFKDHDMLKQDNIDELYTSKITTAFLINPTGINSYKDSQGNLMFVENYASLSLLTDGKIEYSVSATQRGVPIFENQSGTLLITRTHMLSAAKKLLETIGSDYLGGAADVTFHGMEYLEEIEGYRIYFKYTISGFPIDMETSPAGKGCPIYFDIVNGRIVKADILTLSMQSFENGDKLMPLELAIKLIKSSGISQVEKIGLAYLSLDGVYTLRWIYLK